MANLTLDLKIHSANNLVNVNLITKMDVYAVITIHGENTQKKQKAKTTVIRSGGSNPTWNHAVKFSFKERLARDGHLTLVMRLISRRVLGNKDIGRVNIPLLELLNSIMPSINGECNNQEMKLVKYQLRTQSGNRSGSLTFSYLFKPDLPTIINRSLVETPYPPPSQIEHPPSAPPELPFEFPKLQCQNDSDHQKHPFAAGSSYDPLPISYRAVMTEQPYLGLSPYEKSGHTSPPSQQSYGPYVYAPPLPSGYGYGAPLYQQPEGIGFGLGLGAGLLGGLIMGDIVSDVANCLDL